MTEQLLTRCKVINISSHINYEYRQFRRNRFTIWFLVKVSKRTNKRTNERTNILIIEQKPTNAIRYLLASSRFVFRFAVDGWGRQKKNLDKKVLVWSIQGKVYSIYQMRFFFPSPQLFCSCSGFCFLSNVVWDRSPLNLQSWKQSTFFDWKPTKSFRRKFRC